MGGGYVCVCVCARALVFLETSVKLLSITLEPMVSERYLPYRCITSVEAVSGQVRVFNVYIQRTPGTGQNIWEGVRAGPPALAGTREYEQSDWNW